MEEHTPYVKQRLEIMINNDRFSYRYVRLANISDERFSFIRFQLVLELQMTTEKKMIKQLFPFVSSFVLVVGLFLTPEAKANLPYFNISMDDIVVGNSWTKNTDNNGNLYISYPKACIRENSDIYSRIKTLTDNYFQYVDKTELLSRVECSSTDVDYTSHTNIGFDVSAFPVDTKLNYEIFYFSNDLAEEYEGNYKVNSKTTGYSGDRKAMGGDRYKTYSDFGDDMSAFVNQIGFWANITEDYPLTVFLYYVRDTTSSYEIAKVHTIGTQHLFNINVDSGQFTIQDYYAGTPGKLEMKHNRFPFLATPNLLLSTVFQAKLLIGDKEVTRVCSRYAKDYAVAKSAIEDGEVYSTFIDKLAGQNPSDILSIVISFYYESQKNIDAAIDYLDQNFANVGIEKEMLMESLKGVSLLKGNSCLQSITLDTLKSNPTASLAQVNKCYQSGNITSIQKSLIEQLISLNTKDVQLSESFQNEINQMGAFEARKRTKLLSIKSKIKKLYYSMPSFWLRDSCSAGLGYENQSEIIK